MAARRLAEPSVALASIVAYCGRVCRGYEVVWYTPARRPAMNPTHSYLTHLECADCGAALPADVEQHRCACGGILLARYDLPALAAALPRATLAARPWPGGLWRYAE